MIAAQSEKEWAMVPDADLVVYESRDAWLAGRRLGIGSSDAPAVWGVSPFLSQLGLYATKVIDTATEDGADEWLEIGSMLEEPIAQLFAKRTGRVVLYPGATAIYRSRRWPFMCASIDRLVVCPERGDGGVEVKNRHAFAAREWKEGVPIEVQTQVQHQMAVTGRSWWSVAALVGGNKLLTIDIDRDEEFIEMHVEKCADLWKMVQERTPPPADGSESTAHALRQLYAREQPKKIMTLDALDEELAVRREALKRQIAEDSAELKLVDNKLRALIGDAEAGVLRSGAGCFTLKTVNRKGYTVEPITYRELRWRPAKEQ